MRSEVNGVGIELEVSGEGRPVVLLHGFPDSGRLWRNQVPALTGAGFQVIVPDLRGFGRSDKPADVEAYALPFLAADVLGMLDHLRIERAHLVGHDWGAALTWGIASLAAERVDHCVAMSVGHPAAFRSAMGQMEQMRLSWYMLLFQFEGVAEQWLSAEGWANFRAWSAHPDIDGVIAELEANNGLTPALNWYRANVPPSMWVDPPMQLPPIEAPVMGIWSSEDFALTERQMLDSKNYVKGGWRYERIDGAGHWMQLEAAETVNRLLLDFLPA
jgi:pimeloyl-ACP methyl ester carboxylesterase